MAGLDEYPTIHPREDLVRTFELDLSGAVLDVMKNYEDELTTAELLNSLNHVFSQRIASILKYAIRQERHGTTDKPGGLA